MTSFYGGGAASTSGGGGSSVEGALIFKGTLGISDDGATVLVLPDTHEEGWTYLVVTAGTYAGQLCEKGDFVICVSSGESASDLDWTVVQGNTFNTLPTPTALDEGKIISVDTSGNYVLIDNPSSGETENLPDPSEADEGKILSVGADGNYILTDNPAKDKLDKANPTYTGSLTGENAAFSGIVTVATPAADNEAANKSYVDTTLAEAKSYTDSEITDLENGTTELPYVKKSGDTMAGSLTIGTTTINEFGVVQTDKIANTGIMGNGYGIDFSGDPKITNFNTNDFVTLSVGEPTSNGHAATKKYVDDKTQTIAQSVGTETERATEAETTLQTAIDTEVTDRKSADNATKESIQNINQSIESIKNSYLLLAGGELTGPVSTTETEFEENNLVNKKYVDESVASVYPTEIVQGNPVVCEDGAEYGLQGLKVYGKSTQMTTTGAQLIDTQAWQTADSEYYKVAEDGGMILLQNDGRGASYVPPFLALDTGNYTASTDSGFNIQVIKDGVSLGERPTLSFTLDSPATLALKVYPRSPINYPSQPVYAMINAGSSVPPWEPYTGGQASPNPNYPQEIVSAGDEGSIDLTVSNSADQSQSLTISTPNGLPGIPVDSGGNYIDTKGQLRACDVKDYGTGKYTQMVGHIESYNGEAITTPYMSTTGQLSTGAEVYYVLDEPVITDISADELTAYRALHTYDGTTIISTDEDISGLKVKYVAKTIDYQQSINAAIQKTNDKIDAVYNSLVKKAETVDEVNQLFKDWWNANWEDDSSTYNDMLERWFGKVLDDDKVYGVKLPLFETSPSSQGEYIEDSVGAIMLPATEEDPGQNDFAKTPQFWCVEVAAEKNVDGSHTIYACEYIDDIDVVRNGGPDNGKHLVWVLQKNTYVREYEESGYSYIKIQCHPAEGFVQWPQGTDRTGHTYSYIGNPKYAAGIDDEGNIGGRTGLKPTSYMSMNETIQAWRARGPQYSGSSACFYKWAYIMFALLTAKKGEDVGCNNYDYQYAAAVSESGVSRIILTADQANNLYVGSNVIVGNIEGNNDRGQAAMYSLVNQKRISSIEEVTIEEDPSSYKAVYIDVPEGTTFNTTAGTTYISTMPYYSGWTDTVKGTIGTRYGTNLNKQPYLLQKVELMNGAYNYVSDELDEWSQQDDTHYLYSYYLCEDQTKVSTNGTITDDYVKKENATITIDTSVYTTNNIWYYIEDNLTDNNFKMLNPKKFSTSAGSGTGTRDAFYLSYAASGVRAPMVWAVLLYGGIAGLSCRLSSPGSSWTGWFCAGGCPGLSG